MKHFALTIVGRDRAGIVSSTSGLLARSQANIEDASATILGGQFAMILIVSLAEEGRAEALESELLELGRRQDLGVSVRALTEAPAGSPASPTTAYMVSILGADRPGIVHAVTHALSELRANITDLQSKLLPGPEGRTSFAMVLEIEAPVTLALAALQAELEKLHQTLGIDVSARPVESAVL